MEHLRFQRFLALLLDAEWLLSPKGHDRGKEARVSFNNYERFNAARAPTSETRDLIYNDGRFNWIEQSRRGYKITSRIITVYREQASRGFCAERIRGARWLPLLSPQREILTRRGAEIEISFHSAKNGITSCASLSDARAHIRRVIILTARNRITLNRRFWSARSEVNPRVNRRENIEKKRETRGCASRSIHLVNDHKLISCSSFQASILSIPKLPSFYIGCPINGSRSSKMTAYFIAWNKSCILREQKINSRTWDKFVRSHWSLLIFSRKKDEEILIPRWWKLTHVDCEADTAVTSYKYCVKYRANRTQTDIAYPFDTVFSQLLQL